MLQPASCGEHRKCITWETSSLFPKCEQTDATIKGLIAEGKDLFVAGYHNISILDVKTFESKVTVKTNHECIRCMDVSKEQVILGCTHKKLVTLWNRTKGKNSN